MKTQNWISGFICFLLASILQIALGGLIWQICNQDEIKPIEPLKTMQLDLIAFKTAVIEESVETVVEIPEFISPVNPEPEPILPPELKPEKKQKKTIKPSLKPVIKSFSKPILKPILKPVNKPKKKIVKELAPPKKAKKLIKPMTAVPKEVVLPIKAVASIKSEAKLKNHKIIASLKPVVSPVKVVLDKATLNKHWKYLKSVFKILERSKRYPSNARRRNIQGKVKISFCISLNRRSMNLRIINKASPILDRAALKLVGNQRFQRPPDKWNPDISIEFIVNYSLK